MGHKIAGECVIKKDEDPVEIVVSVSFDFGSNQVSFYTDTDKGDISLHLDKEDLKRLLDEFDGVKE